MYVLFYYNKLADFHYVSCHQGAVSGSAFIQDTDPAMWLSGG